MLTLVVTNFRNVKGSFSLCQLSVVIYSSFISSAFCWLSFSYLANCVFVMMPKAFRPLSVDVRQRRFVCKDSNGVSSRRRRWPRRCRTRPCRRLPCRALRRWRCPCPRSAGSRCSWGRRCWPDRRSSLRGLEEQRGWWTCSRKKCFFIFLKMSKWRNVASLYGGTAGI